MSHSGKPIKTLRIVPLELWNDNHRLEGTRFSASSGDGLQVNGRWYFAVRAERTRGPFHLRVADVAGQLYASEPHGALYRPIHSSMKAEDIEGATYAFNDGTAWHFAHCSPGQQLDFAAEVEAFAKAQFDEAIHESNAQGARSDSNVGRNSAFAKSTALIAFAHSIGRRVHGQVVGATLGHFHKDLNTDHKRELTVAAIDRALGTLRQNQEADVHSRVTLGRVSEAATAIRNRLAANPSIEWRHARFVRELRESTLKKDPISGFEYVFTSSVTGAPITAAADLPDNSWPFDKAELATGIVRGNYTYYDGWPSGIGTERPYFIRFKRPAGGGMWVAEKAVKIYGG